MRLRRLTVLTTATAAAAALALAGCSSDSGSDDTGAKPTTSASAAATPDGTSAEPTDENSDAPAASGDLTRDSFAKTVSDATSKAGSYAFTMNTSAGGSAVTTAKGAVVTKKGVPAISMKMNVGGMDVDVRYVDEVWYMNFGDMTGGKFVKIDPKTDTSDIAKQFEQMTSQLDPAAGLEAADAAITSVTKKGAPIEVDGVQAQPYEVVVDPSKVTGAAADQLKSAGAALPDEFVYTYWISDDNLIRKMTFDLAGTSTEMTMTDWDGDVKVTAPKASEITTKPLG